MSVDPPSLIDLVPLHAATFYDPRDLVVLDLSTWGMVVFLLKLGLHTVVSNTEEADSVSKAMKFGGV